MVPTKCKYNWYQIDAKVVITIMKRGLSVEECRLRYHPENNLLEVFWKDDVIFSASLYQRISPENMSLTCTPSNVEVHLQKLFAERWPDLVEAAKTEQLAMASSAKSNVWERMAREVEEEEKKADQNVNKLFQQIYQDADDDVKKAMMKSFSESCGTVLSTNWSEIKEKKTQVKPPDDMEFKKYEI